MEAVITIPIDPVLHLGPIPVHWYGVGYAVAFIVGIRLVDPFFASHGFSEKARTDIFWWNIGVGLTCARLFFVVQQPDLGSYLHPPWRIIAVWEGGMAFFGAFMGCAATCVWLAWRLRLPVWVIFDGGAIFATLPQAIGRIGNIINGDILGPASNLPWATRYTNPESFPQMLHRSDTAYQPAAAYELLVSLVLFAIVIWLVRHRPAGTAAIAYACGYPLSQLLLFFLRDTEPVIAFGLKQAQLTAIAIIVIAVPALVLARQRFGNAFVPGWRSPETGAVALAAAPPGGGR